MSRLAKYLLRNFVRESVALYLVAAGLVWLTQMLRLFDLVTAKGQGMVTLAGQALLTTPPLAREIIYICMGIGLARALRSMQDTRELHSIHTSRRVSAIWSALAVFSIGGALLALFISNWAEPVARKTASRWSAEIAADVLSQALTPGRFTEFSDGLVLYIGGYRSDGTIIDFFADDSRDENVRRTYVASSASIVRGGEGFLMSLRDGRLQVFPKGDKFTEVTFARYDLAVSSLTDPLPVNDSSIQQQDSFSLVYQGLQSNNLSPGVITEVLVRIAEGARVIGICLLVAAFLAFPHARRRRRFFPAELAVLVVAFSERALSKNLPSLGNWGYFVGPALMIAAAVLVFGWRFLPHGRTRETAGVVQDV